MLALLIALSLGKPDDYRLPKAAVILWLISAALLIVVLTNDWHQLVFAFPQNTAVWTDEDYDYAFFYFVIVAYQVVCALATLLIMFSKCRIPNGARRIWPVIPLFLSLLYSVLYIIGVPELRFWFGDLTAFQSVMYIWCFELCIACGYIHSNSRYVDLFEFSVGVSGQITDKDFNIRYLAKNTVPVAIDEMKRAQQNPVLLNGLAVHTMPISGGYAVWTEDVSALLKIKEELECLAEELAERNNLLRYEYTRETKSRKIAEQNRLYNLLQAATQRQIDRIAALSEEYQRISQTDAQKSKALLAEIAVLCSYIKRRKHLTLLTDRDYKVAVGELERAFSESLQTLSLLKVKSMLYIEDDLPMLEGREAAAVFDFYEEVIEDALTDLKSVQVSLTNIKNLRLTLNVCCMVDLEHFAARTAVCYENEGDGYQRLIFSVGGGAK